MAEAITGLLEDENESRKYMNPNPKTRMRNGDFMAKFDLLKAIKSQRFLVAFWHKQYAISKTRT